MMMEHTLIGAAGDRIYAAYIKEDVNYFIDQITTKQNTIRKEGGAFAFKGHAGTFINANDILAFDIEGFNLFNQVEIDLNLNLINPDDCSNLILKQNSLFITDLSVVEDPVRTYNVVNHQGNPIGVWTFGNLIKNIANESSTGVSAKKLLKEWLKGWAYGRTINGQTVPPKIGVYRFLIGPWLQISNSTLPTNYYQTVESLGNGNQWEVDWDNTPEADLLKNAPFKLMAIVNRLDLRGNSAYTNLNNGNGGETRFIYTLEAPFDMSGSGGGNAFTPAGHPPRAADGGVVVGSYTCVNPVDWEGMNVIIEYGNPFNDICHLQHFAQSWLDLSGYSLNNPPNSDFNAALEAITHQVIDPGVAHNKPNKSALDQIRTNERIFFPAACGNQAQASWSKSDWELSQFQIDPTSHLLLPAPVSNTPKSESNVAWYLQNIPNGPLLSNLSTGGTILSTVINPLLPVDPVDRPGSTALLEWTFAHKNQIHAGMHNMPTSFSYDYAQNGNPDQFRLAATAIVDAEQLHYWDIAWYNNSTAHYDNTAYANPSGNYDFDKTVRHQLSLNTCQGCHCGETKTTFTMVRPMPYGQAANYWGAVPNGADGRFPVDQRTLDTRFIKTIGESSINGTTDNNHIQTNNLQYFTRVSPFLTGRNYSGNGTFEDDNHDASQDPDDNTISGTFFVYAPSNFGVDTHPSGERFNRFNDLEMRKNKLCELVNLCNLMTDGTKQSKVLSIVSTTSFMPLPFRGH